MRDILNKLKIKMLLLLTVVYLTVGVLGGLFFYYVFPQYYFKFYPTIVLFYWITGILMNYVQDHYRGVRPEKLLTIFMVSRMIKFMLTLLFLIIVIKVVLRGEHEISFAITLMVNYILYTSLELYIYYLYNKRLTRDADKK